MVRHHRQEHDTYVYESTLGKCSPGSIHTHTHTKTHTHTHTHTHTDRHTYIHTYIYGHRSGGSQKHTGQVSCEFIGLFVYYESIKRELKIRPLQECRCDERLKTKAEESTRLAFASVIGEFVFVKL
jgi:hypothetical protein